MAVTNIPNITNWSVTPQNGQVGYFTLMNTWLSESTAVLASLQTAINAQNTANSEINDLAIQTENNANIAASVGNYQGVWSNLVTYSKSMGVSVGNLYYISKVDSNLNHAVTDTNYWLYNPINDKLDKDFSVLADKTTPSDSDIFATRETGGLLKKLSWANLKATLKTYFDTLYVSLTGNQTISGTKTFNGASKTLIGDNALEVITSSLNSAAGSFMISQGAKYGLGLNGSGTGTVTGSFIFQVIDRDLNTVQSTPFNIGINGVVSYNFFPVTPSLAPVANYQVANKKYVDDSVLGLGQTLQDVKSSRAYNIVYTNSTGKPIKVNIIITTLAGTSASFQVESSLGSGTYLVCTRDSGAAGVSSNHGTIIPAGFRYKMVTSGIPTLVDWVELR